MANIREEIEEQRRLLAKKRIRYSLDFSLYYHEWFNGVILAQLAPDPRLSVLDCGCGTGILLPSLETRYRRTVGLDLSLDNLLEAQISNGRIPLLVGDIGDLPLAPQSFDHVICRGVLHHLPDIGHGFRRLFGVVKDGGDLVVAEPIRDSYVLHLIRVMTGLCSADTYTVREWIQAGHAAGFQIVSWVNLGYLALPLLGRPEVTYVMRYVPFRMSLARSLLRLDNLIARLPYVRTLSWQAVFHFKKPAAPSSNSAC